MPRVWLCPVSLLWCLVVVDFFYIVSIAGDCWYNGNIYEEDIEVKTKEPCLNCTCTRGTLICYLRVCPRLPNPPPPGCILLHKFQTCCPELVCTDFPFSYKRIESRAEPDDLTEYDPPNLKNVCILNGTIYGPGSAMDSSSLCEYCYCLGGRQRCVKPKCLLPIDGCMPLYDSNDCCPVHYNCTGPQFNMKKTTSISSSSTTTTSPKKLIKEGKCFVSGRYYSEGGKVIGVGHSICDNCYCIRGLIRCEPISCAPPLLGCTPVIRQGECCASSYNCSGAIETEPEPNYGNYTILSKDYAKLRKQVQTKPPQQQLNNTKNKDNNAPYYVIAESLYSNTKNLRSPITFGTTRQFTGTTLDPTLKTSYYTNNNNNSNKHNIKHNNNKITTKKYPEMIIDYSYGRYEDVSKKIDNELLYATTNYKYNDINHKVLLHSTTNKPKNTEPYNTINSISFDKKKFINQQVQGERSSSSYDNILEDAGDVLDIVSPFFDERYNRRIDADNKTNTKEEREEESSTENNDDHISTITDITTLEYQTAALSKDETMATDSTYEEAESTTTMFPLTDDVLINVMNSTNCTDKNVTTTSNLSLNLTVSNNNSDSYNETIPSNLKFNLNVGENSKMNITESEAVNITEANGKPLTSENNTIGELNKSKNSEIVEDSTSNNEILMHNLTINNGNNGTNNNETIIINVLTNETMIGNNKTLNVSNKDVIKEKEDNVTLIASNSSIEETTVNNTSISHDDDDDITIVDLESKVKVATATVTNKLKIPVEIEAILNRTKHKENDFDDEYDYNEPSLPPSLPNLKIIPFVAADAVESKKENNQDNTIYPSLQNKPTSTIYTNLFSPPVETEGGFVPRDPPILDGFYDNSYHTTGVDVNSSVTVISASDVTNIPTHKNNCLVDNHEIQHGEEVSSEVTCMICVCYYGNIVCQDVQCPIPRPGCERAPNTTPDSLECCPQLICDEAPTVVLDRSDENMNPKEVLTIPERITPDPFKDVIKTEPAPNLQSLIGDMIPHIRRQTSTIKYVPIKAEVSSSVTTLPSVTTSTHDNSITKPVKNGTKPYTTLDQMLQYLLGEIENNKNNIDGQKTTTVQSETRDNLNNINSIIDNNTGAGILKLAGCNIYGRMYRVGRIIFELSGPCLECKCTETGVQCNSLKC